MRSPLLTLAMGDSSVPPTTAPPDLGVIVALAKQTPATPDPDETAVSDDFVKYLQRAANPHDFGLRSDDRFYPYSTPQGRRIAWRQPVWDKALFARGCTPQEAEQQLRADVNRSQGEGGWQRITDQLYPYEFSPSCATTAATSIACSRSRTRSSASCGRLC